MSRLTLNLLASSTMSLLLIAGLARSASAAEVMSKKETIHRCLLTIYQSEHKDKEAAQEYTALLALKPNDAQTRYDYGNWLLRGNQFGAAITQYRKATQIQPRNADYQGGLGGALLHNQDYAGAVEAYRHAIECQTQGQNFAPQFGQAQQYLQHQKAMERYKQQLKQQEESQ